MSVVGTNIEGKARFGAAVANVVSKAVSGVKHAMGGVNIGSGQISVGNVVTLVGVAAMVWFGATVTSDHDQVNKIPAALQNIQASVDDTKNQVGALNTLMAGFQRDLAETRARLDCEQGVGSAEACPMLKGRRR